MSTTAVDSTQFLTIFEACLPVLRQGNSAACHGGFFGNVQVLASHTSKTFRTIAVILVVQYTSIQRIFLISRLTSLKSKKYNQGPFKAQN